MKEVLVWRLNALIICLDMPIQDYRKGTNK